MPLPLEDGGEVITNSTNQMLDVVNNKKQRKGNRRHNNNNNSNNNNNNNHRNKNKNNNRNNNNNNQNDGALSEDTNPASVITVFNRTGTINHKLRKNDAVKVIQTPNGKVGIVYQSTKTASNKQDNFPIESQWDDVYTQHQSNHYVNRNANDVKMLPPTADEQPINKIIPVLTSDGKIALVYRGDSSRYNNEHNINGSSNSVGYNKKYEPLTNYSSSIMTTLNNNDNNNIKLKNDSINMSVGDSKLHQEQQSNLLINRLDEFLASVTNKVKHIEEVVEEELGIIDSVPVTTSTTLSSTTTVASTTTTTTTTTEQPIIQGDYNNGNGNHQNPLLINRPLSEVLGIKKKTYFHHPDRESSTIENPTIPTTPWDERRTTQRIELIHTTLNSIPTMDTNTIHEEFDLENPEMINIAIIPGFDSEMEERLFGKSKDNRSNSGGGSSSGAHTPVHCAMQAMIAVSLMVAAFGMLGAYYKVHIVNQIRVMYW